MIEAKTILKYGFWILEKKSKLFFQHYSWKKTSIALPISPLRGFLGNKFIFLCGTNGMFFPITREDKSKWGQILFLLFWFNSLKHQIGQHICHFSTRFMLKSTYATRTTITVLYTIEIGHFPQYHASKS